LAFLFFLSTGPYGHAISVACRKEAHVYKDRLRAKERKREREKERKSEREREREREKPERREKSKKRSSKARKRGHEMRPKKET